MTITTGPLNPVDGPVDVDLGAESGFPWHEIAVSITDEFGVKLDPVLSGVLQGSALGVGSDEFEDFKEALDLTIKDRRFTPFFSIISKLKFTPVNFPANSRYIITVINTRG